MTFRKAWFQLLNGKKITKPDWSGYWVWENNTIMLYCKDGSIIDIRETKNVAYTFSFIATDDWQIFEENSNIETDNELISNYKEKDKLQWISLSDQYPKEYEYVLLSVCYENTDCCYYTKSGYYNGDLNNKDKSWIIDNVPTPEYRIMGWMPYPEPLFR